jgi:hypothetical protein
MMGKIRGGGLRGFGDQAWWSNAMVWADRLRSHVEMRGRTELCAPALPTEATKPGEKVLHGVSLQRITVVLGALAGPRRSTAHRRAKPTG